MSFQNPSTLSTGQNQVIIRLHNAIIPPNLAHIVIPHLTSSSKEFVAGGSNGVHRESRSHSFFEIDDDGYLKTAAGLLPRIVDACQSRSIAIQVVDRSRWPVLEQLAAELSAYVNAENRSLLNAVAASPRGRIVAHGSDHFKLVILICRTFATERVLILTANREQRDRILAKVKSKLKRPVSTHDKIAWGASNRVTVITAHFFAGIGRINNDFDVILFVGPETVTGDQAFETAAQLDHELIYCLVPPSYRSDELTQLRLEAVCGSVINDDVATDAAVQVVIVACPSIRFAGNLSPLARKRAAFWNNDQRNDVIANLALVVASQDVSTFSPRSEFLPEHIDLLTTTPNPGIAILVESSEHGRELLRRLPGWTLNTANPDRDGVLDGGTCHRNIITQAFSRKGIHTDILIRATGTNSPLVVRGFPAIGQRRATMVIDLADEFDYQAIRETQERIRDYRSRRWIVNARNKPVTNQVKTRQQSIGAAE